MQSTCEPTLVLVLRPGLVLLHEEGSLGLHPLLGLLQSVLHQGQPLQSLVSRLWRLLRQLLRELVL